MWHAAAKLCGISNDNTMKYLYERYKNDPLDFIKAAMLWSNFGFTLTPLRAPRYIPYYLGILTACSLASFIIIIWKCTHGAGKEPYTWTGGILPIVYSATVIVCWFTSDSVEPDWWGVKLLMTLLFIPLTWVLQRCSDEDVRDSADNCILYIIMCMALTQV